ncbi:uncharacterized protein BDR25DRAFT_299507 [Lindgomyces ingoldianus]|uniref:Uncharacterized protein n=1 Tax=Lindgomyces ingoldianus TaxID=673940 RepID=A0ACB6RFU3_9PLEO|nr:uncharacterized protein BDR25DRAFT_299507 [Lindgomyces ingoldianus]KAF2477638.1 hypothetical protein BDR25DRAFT_299507 [Lindgomyces ingoldianus]
MPFTIAAFITRRPEVSPTDFATYYDTKQIPLMKSLVGDDMPSTVTRYYVKRAKSDPSGLTPLAFGGNGTFDYDLVSFFKFADEPAALKFQQKYADKEIEKQLAMDLGEYAQLDKFKVIAFQDPIEN